MMDMLLRDITISDLADIFSRHASRSPAPHLTDPQAMERAREHARENGIWQRLEESFNPEKDIPVIKRSAYRNFRRVGDRTLPQAVSGARQRELTLATLALYLEHPKADVDYLQDLLWAYCDDYTWVMAAHEGRAIDLGSAMLAATLAEILHIVGHRLEEEVKERVSSEIERRIFQKFWDYKHFDSWKTERHNWNHVCNGEIIRTALYQMEDPVMLAHMVHGAIQNMTYALDGFTDDGGCVEGAGYWDYGFGHYAYVAHDLFHKTGGEVNIMSDAKVERICRYPLSSGIAGRIRSTFADSGHGYIPARVAMILNKFYPLEALYTMCDHHADGTLKLHDLHEFALYDGQRASGETDSQDYVLPDLGQVKLRGKAGQVTVMALAGNNGVNHNHNDIGSFIVYRDGEVFFVDPGSPTYSQKTFSAQRYESVFCNSVGHSVPVINGNLQPAGKEYFGSLEVENLNGSGVKTAIIDMTHAYPSGTVHSLVRVLALDTEKNALSLEDKYSFDVAPTSLEEAFITFHEVDVIGDGEAVKVGRGGKSMTVTSVGAPGRFHVQALVEESKEGRTGDVIRRITFVPDALDREMRLKFAFE